MKTAGKVALGAVLLGGVVLVVALSGGKEPQRTPPPPRRTPPPPDRTPSPTPPLPPPASTDEPLLPFALVQEAAGSIVDIRSAAKMLPWVIGQAKAVKAGKLSDARGVLQKIARRVSKDDIAGVRFREIPGLDIPWADVLNSVKNIPWGTIKPLANQFLKGYGIV